MLHQHLKFSNPRMTSARRRAGSGTLSILIFFGGKLKRSVLVSRTDGEANKRK